MPRLTRNVSWLNSAFPRLRTIFPSRDREGAVGEVYRKNQQPLSHGHGSVSFLRFTSLALFALLILGSAASIWAQSEAQIESDEVKRVGSHLSCQCGACQENLNCMMSAGQCHFCKPARTKIYAMQSGGMSDSEIVAAFVKEYGEKIFRKDPNNYFWVVPYVSLGLGCIAIVLILRRVYGRHPSSPASMQPAVAGGAPHIDDPELARYRDAIEKETDRLE